MNLLRVNLVEIILKDYSKPQHSHLYRIIELLPTCILLCMELQGIEPCYRYTAGVTTCGFQFLWTLAPKMAVAKQLKLLPVA